MALTDNLVAYWTLDESSGNADDSVGTNDLTNYNTTAYATGKINNGLDLESSSSNYMLSPAFSGGTSWTYSFWFKPESLIDQVIVGQDDVDANRIFSHIFGDTNVTFYGWKSDGTIKHTASTAHGMATGSWYHWVCVWDSAGNMQAYKNGSPFASGVATTGNAKATSEELCIGRQNSSSPTYYSDGVVDEVGVWSRALTASEVTALYNDGDGLQYPFSSIDYTLTAETGTLTLTGYDATLGKSMSLLAETGNFILRGYDAILTILRCTGWQKQTKNTTTWTDQTKNSTTWTDQTKNSTTWDNQDRN
jgi:hypothetical protein